jgi:cephalosporin hydroxylase
MMQEIIYKLQPEFIIETGTAYGGSSIFFASILNLIGKGHIITVDINNKLDKDNWSLPVQRLFDKHITFIQGSSTDSKIVSNIFNTVGDSTCLIMLDSWHTKVHVLEELNIYSKLIKPNYYIIVEDTHVNGNPVPWKWGDGPMEAVEEFLKVHPNFQPDLYYERHGMTCNPTGFLKRVN